MFGFALKHVRDCFESAVRMVGRTLGFAWGVDLRFLLIEHEKRIEHVESGRWKRAIYSEPSAFKLSVRRDDTDDPAYAPEGRRWVNTR